METIIAILFVILPVIFKLIGKKLEQAGQSEQAETMRKIARSIGGAEDDDDSTFRQWQDTMESTVVEHDDDGQVTEIRSVVRENAPVASVPPVQAEFVPDMPVAENVVRQTLQRPVVKRKAVVKDTPQVRQREKIDPRKLVIYSEIMKPKYTE